jgi:hypothetical protein
LAAFRGSVACRRTADVLTLTGFAADSAEDVLILTFIAPKGPDVPDRLTGATVRELGESLYGIASASRDWVVEATSAHVHRDIGNAFYRAVPPRPTPLKKRLFWRVVLALAASRAGKRLLLSLRRET